MQITFFGGAQEVGRSCFLVEHNSKNILLDCGIKLGEKTEYPLLDETQMKKIRHVAITHAHLDHSGYLPHLFAKSPSSTFPHVYMTKPTRDLISVLLADYQRIQKDRSAHFKTSHVNSVLQKATMIEYSDFNTSSSAFSFSFLNAGHILGSAMVYLKEMKLLYTGDICLRKTRILEPCERNLPPVETIIIENTYGKKTDAIPSYKESAQRIVQSINKTIREGGWVIIPSFAVGRAQEVLLMLDDYMRSGALIQVPIYVEGMINKAMRIYRHNALYASSEIQKRILMSEDDPFKSKFFHVSRNRERRDVLSQPCIIVTTSGMLTGGPVHFYLDKLGSDPKNKLIFVGYQAEGTPGRKILDGERKVKIGHGTDEKEISIGLEIDSIRMSGHADYNDLLQFIKGISGLKRVILVHGEHNGKGDLADSLESSYEVYEPKVGEEISYRS